VIAAADAKEKGLALNFMFIFICSGCQDYPQIENPGTFQRIAPSHCNLMSNKRRTGEKAAATLHYRKRCLGQIAELVKRPGYHHTVMAFIACGIALNCIPVVI